jgi:hypothetical protein
MKIETALNLNSERESVPARVERIERYIAKTEGMVLAVKVMLGLVVGDSGLAMLAIYWIASGRH